MQYFQDLKKSNHNYLAQFLVPIDEPLFHEVKRML